MGLAKSHRFFGRLLLTFLPPCCKNHVGKRTRPRKSLSSNLRYMSGIGLGILPGKGGFNHKSLGERPKMWDLEVCFGKKNLLSFGRNKKTSNFWSQQKPAKNKGSKSPTAQELHQPTPPYLGHTMLPTSEISLRQRIENRGPGDAKGSAQNVGRLCLVGG